MRGRNGKLIKEGFKAYAYVNGICVKKMRSNRIRLDYINKKTNDSIYFLIHIKGIEIYTNKFASARFKHGGDITTGIISDYSQEKQKFSKGGAYFQENQANGLYDILVRAGKQDSKYIFAGYGLKYSIVRSSITFLVNFKYDFYDLK